MTCKLGALTPGERARQQALLQQFRNSLLSTEVESEAHFAKAQVDLGRMPLETLGEWISLERRCCPFLAFEIQVAAGVARADLRIGGSAEAKSAAMIELLDVPRLRTGD